MRNIYKIASILCINVLIIVVFKILESFLEIELAEPKLKNTYKDHYWGLFISAVLVAPLLEEYTYRHQLVKNRYVYLSLIWNTLFVIIGYDWYIIIPMIITNIMILIFYYILKKERLPILFLSVYVVVFAISHLGNYDVNALKSLPWYYLFLQFFPQLLSGGILTYIRIQFRFTYAVLYHAVYNFIIFSIFMISQLL